LPVVSYTELFSLIGYTFGGSGANFNKPDLRGEFVRGWDDSRGVDVGRVFGSWQDSDNKSHDHNTTVNTAGAHDHTGSADSAGSHSHSLPLDAAGGSIGITSNMTNDGVSTIDTSAAGIHTHTLTLNSAGGHTHSVTVSGAGTVESRPRNIALKPYIKLYQPPAIIPVDVTSTQDISGTKTFVSSLILMNSPQALIFGDPTATGTQALGMIGSQMAITMHTSAGVWIPVVWLS
jgi:microcystin-dependent protein